LICEFSVTSATDFVRRRRTRARTAGVMKDWSAGLLLFIADVFALNVRDLTICSYEHATRFQRFFAKLQPQQRPPQCELNLWPKRPTVSGTSSTEFVRIPSKHSLY